MPTVIRAPSSLPALYAAPELFGHGIGGSRYDGDVADRTEALEGILGLDDQSEHAYCADGRNHGEEDRDRQHARRGGQQHDLGAGDPQLRAPKIEPVRVTKAARTSTPGTRGGRCGQQGGHGHPSRPGPTRAAPRS